MPFNKVYTWIVVYSTTIIVVHELHAAQNNTVLEFHNRLERVTVSHSRASRVGGVQQLTPNVRAFEEFESSRAFVKLVSVSRSFLSSSGYMFYCSQC